MTELIVKCNDNVVLPNDRTKTLEIPLNTYLYVDDLVLELKGATYEIVSTSEGVAISEGGLVSIPGTFNAGDVNGTDIIIRINAERNGEHYVTDKTIHVSPAPDEEYTSPVKSDFSVLDIKRDTDETQFVFFAEDLAGTGEIEIETKRFLLGDVISEYQVSKKYSDDTVTVSRMKADKGVLLVENGEAVGLEVTPVYKFIFGYEDGSGEEGAVRVPGNAEYTADSTFGFVGERIMSVGHVGFAGDSGSCFVFTVPEGFYDVTVFKADEERSTIRINGGSVGTNVGNPGKGGRKGITPYSYRVSEVHATGGIITISMDERGRTLRKVEIVKSTSLRKRRPHIFVGGDSTASCYYPIEEKEPAPGRFQTGWGQVFGQYLTDRVVVVNIAGGGTFAKSWYEMAFPGVIKHGMPGDVFLIEEGINDRTYSNAEEMAAYLSKMISECREAGIIPVLVTAMQTAKFWKDRDGNELPEFGRPEASGLYVYAERIRQVAIDKGVCIIDAAMITSDLYEKLGRTFVARNFHIYNPATETEEDTLHLSYAGAQNVAGIVATELLKMTDAALGEDCRVTKDCFNAVADLEYVFTDTEGRQCGLKVSRVCAGYKTYGM